MISAHIDVNLNLVVYLAFVVFGASIFLARWIVRIRTDRRAMMWPKIRATIHNSYEIFDSHHPSKKAWATALQYSYELNGEFYSGTYFLPGFCREDYLAAERGKKWMNQAILVRYNPADPQDSTFLIEDGAPGRPYVPRTPAPSPKITQLHLK